MPRVALRFTLALLIIAVAFAPLLLVLGWLRVERNFESSMLRNAAFCAAEAVRALREPDNDSRLNSIARVHRVRIRVCDEHGATLSDVDFDSGRDLSQRAGRFMLGPQVGPERDLELTLGALAARPEFARALSGERVEGCRDLYDHHGVVCHAVRLASTSSALRVVYVQDSAERPITTLYELGFQLKRLTLLVLPLALLLAWWGGERMVRPLRTLRDQVLAKVREPRPKPDLVAPANDETQDLAEAFNTLLERLSERRAENEAFVADLVHEFKNPVATIRACGDALGSHAGDPERAERVARLLRESSSRLDALVTQFLELARAEAGMLRESWEIVDLAALARGSVQSVRECGRWPTTAFAVSAPTEAKVRGVRERLETALGNLLDNAASFAGPGGHVSVEVTMDHGEVLLAVSDDGPGIAPEDRPHVFERFFTTRRHQKGTGLGLALVRAIVEGHGGGVAVMPREAAGTTLTATFPALGPD